MLIIIDAECDINFWLKEPLWLKKSKRFPLYTKMAHDLMNLTPYNMAIERMKSNIKLTKKIQGLLESKSTQ